MLWLFTVKTLFCLTKRTYKIIKRNETRPPFLGGRGGGGGGWTGSSSPICRCGAVIFAERMYDCMYDSLLISLCRKKSVMAFSNKC